MKRLLLIDDDADLRRALRLGFEGAGFEVEEAEEGRKGVAAFARRAADLVITDIVMPDMEGVETICKLRAMDARVPIFAMSGGGRAGPEGYLHIAKSLGATEVFAKPVAIGMLLSAADHVLSRPPPIAAPALPG